MHADNLDKYIPVLAAGPLAMAGEPNGFWLVSIVQGSFLNEAVNPMRVAFTDENIEGAPPAEGDGDGRPADEHVHEEPTTDLFGEPKSIKVIRADALKAVREELEPIHRGGGAGPV